MNERERVTCDRQDDERAIRYVRGELDVTEQEQFEDHYFECAACLATVQALQAGSRVLSGGRPVTATPPGIMRLPAWAMAASVAALAVGALVTLRATGIMRPGSVTPVPTLAATAPPPVVGAYRELAEVEPAAYAPLVMRGQGAPDGAFAVAMQKYLRRDFAGAAQGLREVLRSGTSAPEVRFYLGVSELLAGRPEVAAEELRGVAVSAAEPALIQESRFYRAKALLALQSVAEAEAELQAATAGGGDRAAEARDLLQRIDAVRDRSR